MPTYDPEKRKGHAVSVMKVVIYVEEWWPVYELGSDRRRSQQPEPRPVPGRRTETESEYGPLIEIDPALYQRYKNARAAWIAVQDELAILERMSELDKEDQSP